MTAYSKATGAKIFIGASTATTLPAPGSDTFTEVPATSKITPPGNKQDVKPYRILNDNASHSQGGAQADKAASFEIVIDWAQTPHTNIEADSLVAGGQKRNWRIVYPDSGNRQYDFIAMVSEFTPDEFDAEQQGAPHRAKVALTIDGTVTITP